jgi:putative sterol carrier protein
VATVEECEKALHDLASRLDDKDPSDTRRALDRTLSCELTDLGVRFAGRLHDGRLDDVHQIAADDRSAQVKLGMKSDDLIKLVAGDLNLAAAWATGRVKVDASMRDILRLRSIF